MLLGCVLDKGSSWLRPTVVVTLEAISTSEGQWAKDPKEVGSGLEEHRAGAQSVASDLEWVLGPLAHLFQVSLQKE